MPDEQPSLRIGELSRRLGVSDHVLRAWERRYGLLRPVRTQGGFRLYSGTDERRVRRMLELIETGLSAAEAASAVLAENRPARGEQRTSEPPGGDLAAGAAALRIALDRLDEPAAQRVLDGLLAEFTIETVLRDVVIPHLRDLGERWADGELSVAHEHFASNVLRGRLTSLARGWGSGGGPRALLACPPGEEHDLALLTFGIALNRTGWRVAFLGANTPIADVSRAATDLGARLVVLAATTEARYRDVATELGKLGARCPLAIAGPGAGVAIADGVGARLLTADPVSAAQQIPA